MSYCCSSKSNNNLQHCLSLSPCTGQSLDGKTSFYLARAKQSNQPGSLQRPQDNSFLTQETYHCSCGPEDFSKELPDALTQQRAKDSRVSGKARGNFRKRGCLAQFKVTRLYCWPDVAQLSLRHAAHTDAAGNAAHGDVITAQGVRHMYAPALSAEMKDWVRTRLLSGVPTRQILKEHWKNVWPKLNAGTADRDCFLVSQDIRNIHSKLAQLSWKLHQKRSPVCPPICSATCKEHIHIKSSTAVSPVSLLCPLSRHLLINTHSLQCMLSHHPLIIPQSLQMLCSSQCLLSTVHSLQTLHSSHSSSKSL